MRYLENRNEITTMASVSTWLWPWLRWLPWLNTMASSQHRFRRCVKKHKAQWARFKLGRSRCSIYPAAAPVLRPQFRPYQTWFTCHFSLAWRVVFGKQNYYLTITNNIIVPFLGAASKPRIVVKVLLTLWKLSRLHLLKKIALGSSFAYYSASIGCDAFVCVLARVPQCIVQTSATHCTI